MNWRMYTDPVFQDRLGYLKEKGLIEVEPDKGEGKYVVDNEERDQVIAKFKAEGKEIKHIQIYEFDW